MTRTTYGLIAGAIAAGVGAWWWRRTRSAAVSRLDTSKGTVIFDNTPQASTLGTEL